MVSEKVAHEERIRENGGFEKFPAFRKWKVPEYYSESL
jgi:hypothetical protein